MIGMLIMGHGDDRGLMLPPKIAPYQVVIVPILGKEDDKVLPAARELAQSLSQRFRVKLDDRDAYTPGWKFNEWELRGVPVRLEIGPRDVAAGQAVLVRRTGGGKETVSLQQVADTLKRVLDEIQSEMFRRGKAFLEAHTGVAATLDELVRTLEKVKGFVRVGWCEMQSCEDTIREKTGASPRVIPLDSKATGACPVCGMPAKVYVYYARAY